MKVYLFYLIKDKIEPKEFPGLEKDYIREVDGKEIALYAYTPMKECADYFSKTRKRKIFYQKVVKMSREEYDDFVENNPAQLLEYHLITTYNIKYKKKHADTMKLLCTLNESDAILYCKEGLIANCLDDIFGDKIEGYLNTEILKKHIRKALGEILLYDEIMTHVHPIEDFNVDICTVDDLALFIRTFKNTLNFGGIK